MTVRRTDFGRKPDAARPATAGGPRSPVGPVILKLLLDEGVPSPAAVEAELRQGFWHPEEGPERRWWYARNAGLPPRLFHCTDLPAAACGRDGGAGARAAR